MTQYGFHFDGKRCTGCKTCVLACKDNKDLSAEISFRKVYEYGGGTWSQSDGLWSNDAFGYYVSVACNHCDSPACMAKCPQGAISKDPDTGIVNNDPEKCIGCGTCAIACPYSAPKVDEEIKKAVRCDMCADRVAEGKQPICVEAWDRPVSTCCGNDCSQARTRTRATMTSSSAPRTLRCYTSRCTSSPARSPCT